MRNELPSSTIRQLFVLLYHFVCTGSTRLYTVQCTSYAIHCTSVHCAMCTRSVDIHYCDHHAVLRINDGSNQHNRNQRDISYILI